MFYTLSEELSSILSTHVEWFTANYYFSFRKSNILSNLSKVTSIHMCLKEIERDRDRHTDRDRETKRQRKRERWRNRWRQKQRLSLKNI